MSEEQRGKRMYSPGDKVRILRGELAGQVFTVHECTADEITFEERLRRQVMSKENVEPA